MSGLKPALLGALAIAAIGVSGCATKKFVRESVAPVQASADQVETRTQQVSATAQEALNRATAAGKLAEGKFLYEVVLSDDSVKFAFDKWELSPGAQASLDAMIERVRTENKNVYVEIQGHTDATGPDTYNDTLGEERAEAVRRYLNQKGVALNRMSTISYGEKAPVAPNENRDGRAQNRRVALVVMS
jgi:peptidoglycan-associated lipoprotein